MENLQPVNKLFHFYFDKMCIRDRCGVEQAARGHKAAHRQAAFPDNQLAGRRVHLVGVLVEVALHAVNLHRLRDVSGNHPVVGALFRQVLVIVESGLVAVSYTHLYVYKRQTDKKLQINDLWLFLLPESPASKTSKVR